jgi:hypothetical protein
LKYRQLLIFILPLFYASSQIALTRYFCHMPKYSFSDTPFTCLPVELWTSWLRMLVSNTMFIFQSNMVVGFTTTCAISTYHHWSCEVEPRSWRGVHYVIKLSVTATGRGFSPGTPISSRNKTDNPDITALLLKVALSTINP